ncbi:MAG: hypothetical protein H6741_19025 [Alphaproteobacteria bacterium]|nr:hypothetical protein [Alphaproteobacteria bacterium]MCB9794804.1 hypothetical protein [Alphaproteobacteria bacterium]
MPEKSTPLSDVELTDRLLSGVLSLQEFTKRALMPMNARREDRGPPKPVDFTRRFRRTGVVVRLEYGPTGTTVHGVVHPDALSFQQAVTGDWDVTFDSDEHECRVGSRKVRSKAGHRVPIAQEEPFSFGSPKGHAVGFRALQPPWTPNGYRYSIGDKQFGGAEMWFEIKVGLDDRVERPIYNVQSSGGLGNFVLCAVRPGQSTIRCYYTDFDYKVHCVAGEGAVEFTKEQGGRVAFHRGEGVVIPRGHSFSISNASDSTLLVRIRSRSPRAWSPATSFWANGEGKFVTGDQVYFEFVFPD